MKTFLKLAAVALLVAAQPVFALPPGQEKVPDGGATAVLALISVGGLLAGKTFLKKR